MTENPIRIGDRVAAVANIKDGKVYFYGYGVYQGRHVPPIVHELDSLSKPQQNPRILLDSGKIIWGFECWWLRERDFMGTTPPETIELVDIDDTRRKTNSLLEENS